MLDLRSLARSHTDIAINALSGIARNGENEGARVSAASVLLDRGWGKAVQPHDANVSGELKITIRKIIEGKE